MLKEFCQCPGKKEILPLDLPQATKIPIGSLSELLFVLTVFRSGNNYDLEKVIGLFFLDQEKSIMTRKTYSLIFLDLKFWASIKKI